MKRPLAMVAILSVTVMLAGLIPSGFAESASAVNKHPDESSRTAARELRGAHQELTLVRHDDGSTTCVATGRMVARLRVCEARPSRRAVGLTAGSTAPSTGVASKDFERAAVGATDPATLVGSVQNNMVHLQASISPDANGNFAVVDLSTGVIIDWGAPGTYSENVTPHLLGGDRYAAGLVSGSVALSGKATEADLTQESPVYTSPGWNVSLTGQLGDSVRLTAQSNYTLSGTDHNHDVSLTMVNTTLNATGSGEPNYEFDGGDSATVWVSHVVPTHAGTNSYAARLVSTAEPGKNIMSNAITSPGWMLRTFGPSVKPTVGGSFYGWFAQGNYVDPHSTAELGGYLTGPGYTDKSDDAQFPSRDCKPGQRPTCDATQDVATGTSSCPAFFTITNVHTKEDVARSGPTCGSASSGGLNDYLENIGGPNPAESKCFSCAGDPVNTLTGEYYQTAADVAVASPDGALDVRPTYSSALPSTGLVGNGWSSVLQMHASTDYDGNGVVFVHQENGSTVPFTPGSSSTFTAPSRVHATLSTNADRTLTFVRNHTEVFHFSSDGVLLDFGGLGPNHITVVRDAGGRPAALRDSHGTALTFAFNGGGLVASIRDPRGNAVVYGYDTDGDLTSVTSRSGNKTSYSYDAQNRLTQVVLPDVRTTTTSYDASGRVAKQVTSAGTTTYVYSGSTSTITDASGVKTVDTFSSTGLLASRAVTAGSLTKKTTYTYDSASQGLLTVTDALGNKTVKTVNADGKPLTVTDPLGHKTVYSYNSLGEVLSTTSPGGSATTYTYDSLGSPLTEKHAVGSTSPTVSYAYTDPKNPTSPTVVTDPLGNKTSITYNVAGQVASTTDPIGGVTAYSYNPNNQVTTITTPLGHATSRVYNPDGHVTSITDPAGNTVSITYNAANRIGTMTSPAGEKTTYNYDASGNPASITQANGDTQRTSYTAAGDLTKVTDAAGNVTAYAYDGLHRNTSVTTPTGKVTRYAYDLDDHLTSTTRPNGQVIATIYNSVGQPTSTTATGMTAVTRSFDADGDLTKLVDGSGTSTFAFDALHRVTAATRGNGTTVRYSRDLDGHIATITYPNGKVVTNTYDQVGRQSSVADWSGNIVRFAYDGDSNLASTSFPNGVTDTRTYDNSGRTASIKLASPTATLGTFAYTYTANSQPKTFATTGPGQASQAYGYDTAGRLTSTSGGSLTYSSSNNLTVAEGGATQTFSADGAVSTRTLAGATTQYAYSTNGERTADTPSSGSAHTWTFDAMSDPTTYKTGTATTQSYTYDGFGLLEKSAGTGAQTLALDFTTSAPRILALTTHDFIYGPNGPVEQFDDTTATATYLHADAHGSTRDITNSAGAVTGTYDYTAYGAVKAHTGTAATELRYDGQYQDNSGLIWLRARFYDPYTGDFTSRDPAYALTGDAYGYAGEDPNTYHDPSGLCIEDACIAEGEALLSVAEEAPAVIDAIETGELLSEGVETSEVLAEEAEEESIADEILACDSPAGAADTVAARGGVYTLRDEAGNVVRSGRTKDLAARETAHANDPVLGDYQFNVEHRTDVYAEQRGLEQMLYDRYPGAQAANGGFNKIRGISPFNPNLDLYMQSAWDSLERMGLG